MTWQEDAEVAELREAAEVVREGLRLGVDPGHPGVYFDALDRLTAALEEKYEMIKAALAWHGQSLKERDEARERLKDAFQALDELEEAGSDPAPLRVVRFALGDEK